MAFSCFHVPSFVLMALHTFFAESSPKLHQNHHAFRLLRCNCDLSSHFHRFPTVWRPHTRFLDLPVQITFLWTRYFSTKFVFQVTTYWYRGVLTVTSWADCSILWVSLRNIVYIVIYCHMISKNMIWMNKVEKYCKKYRERSQQVSCFML